MKIPPSIRSLAAVAAISSLTLPSAALADPVPSYATQNRSAETVHGTIATLTGSGDLYVRDDRGFVDHVRLHQGTVIEPTGFELGSGNVVTIIGQNAGSVLRADEIDAVPSGDASIDGSAPAEYGDQGYAVDTYPYDEYYPYGYIYPYGYDYGVGFYFGGGYGRGGYGGYHDRYPGHGYAGHGGYVGGYNRGGASYGRGASGGSRSFSGGGGSTRGGGGGSHR